jgi:hypothetical protein
MLQTDRLLSAVTLSKAQCAGGSITAGQTPSSELAATHAQLHTLESPSGKDLNVHAAAALAGCSSSLSLLGLTGCTMTSDAFSQLSSLQGLTSLQCNDVRMSPSTLSAALHLPRLRVLVATGPGVAATQWVPVVDTHATRLQLVGLDLNGCTLKRPFLEVRSSTGSY